MARAPGGAMVVDGNALNHPVVSLAIQALDGTRVSLVLLWQRFRHRPPTKGIQHVAIPDHQSPQTAARSPVARRNARNHSRAPALPPPLLRPRRRSHRLLWN